VYLSHLLELDFEWFTEGSMEVNRLIIFVCDNVVIGIVQLSDCLKIVKVRLGVQYHIVLVIRSLRQRGRLFDCYWRDLSGALERDEVGRRGDAFA
jgi:hypothetical protein